MHEHAIAGELAATTDANPVSWLTAGAASRLSGLHRSTLKRYAAQGHIRGHRLPGGHWRFHARDIQGLRRLNVNSAA